MSDTKKRKPDEEEAGGPSKKQDRTLLLELRVVGWVGRSPWTLSSSFSVKGFVHWRSQVLGTASAPGHQRGHGIDRHSMRRGGLYRRVRHRHPFIPPPIALLATSIPRLFHPSRSCARWLDVPCSPRTGNGERAPIIRFYGITMEVRLFPLSDVRTSTTAATFANLSPSSTQLFRGIVSWHLSTASARISMCPHSMAFLKPISRSLPTALT